MLFASTWKSEYLLLPAIFHLVDGGVLLAWFDTARKCGDVFNYTLQRTAIDTPFACAFFSFLLYYFFFWWFYWGPVYLLNATDWIHFYLVAYMLWWIPFGLGRITPTLRSRMLSFTYCPVCLFFSVFPQPIQSICLWKRRKKATDCKLKFKKPDLAKHFDKMNKSELWHSYCFSSMFESAFFSFRLCRTHCCCFAAEWDVENRINGNYVLCGNGAIRIGLCVAYASDGWACGWTFELQLERVDMRIWNYRSRLIATNFFEDNLFFSIHSPKTKVAFRLL